MATIFVYTFYAYLCIGLVFATWFTVHGVDRIDAGMHGAPWGVRLLIYPGSVLLWPLLLQKYLSAK